MTPTDSPVLPPRTPAWFVELFASPQEADGILGDLAEEFGASVARDGDKEARRRYRRQAWRTIRDLALSPWSTRPSAGSGTFPGLALAMGIGFTGLVMTFPIAMATGAATSALVTRYPIYDYVPTYVFLGIVQFISPLMAGFIAALIARGIRFRPMTAGLALVVATAVLLAVDMPIMMWLYGAPMRTVTLSWWMIRWVRGVLMFGGVMLIGAAIGRMAPFPDNFMPLRPPRSVVQPRRWRVCSSPTDATTRVAGPGASATTLCCATAKTASGLRADGPKALELIYSALRLAPDHPYAKQDREEIRRYFKI